MFSFIFGAFHSSGAVFLYLGLSFSEAFVSTPKFHFGSDLVKSYSVVDDGFQLRPSATEKAKTVTKICTGGTLCSIQSPPLAPTHMPFGSHVNFVTDDQGSPFMMLQKKSPHNMNIEKNPHVSLTVQLPSDQYGQSTATLSRLTMSGKMEKLSPDVLASLKTSYGAEHSHNNRQLNSNKVQFLRLVPSQISFTESLEPTPGRSNLNLNEVNMTEYQSVLPDAIARQVPKILHKLNLEKQNELQLLCKHMFTLLFHSDVTDNKIASSSAGGKKTNSSNKGKKCLRRSIEEVKIEGIDRLGIDVRVIFNVEDDEASAERNCHKNEAGMEDKGHSSALFRICFRSAPANSVEEAKSEIVKLFQESWERDRFENTCPSDRKDADYYFKDQELPVVHRVS